MTLQLYRDAFAACPLRANVLAAACDVFTERKLRLLACACSRALSYARPRREVIDCRDGLVVKLAQAIYGDRLFDRMPILVDALEDAGCIDGGLLTHLRSEQNHWRGCWALDAILGKPWQRGFNMQAFGI